MAPEYLVVDGSNIATEGRSIPSLPQLDEAVTQYQAEFPGTEVIVVVDATFGHRIEPSERAAFDEAVAHAEMVSPPAGAVGRGDAFLLRVAERVGAKVLSNDSFQEFHAEHPWLFDQDRLIGGKPVPGVGWIFTPRSPVRGVRSRAAVAAATRTGAKKAARAAGGAKKAKAAKATKADAPAKAAPVDEGSGRKAAKAAKAAKAQKSTTKKAATADGAAKKAKGEKAAEPAKAAKGAKAAKAAKAAKVAKATKASGPPPAAEAGKGSSRRRRGRGRRASNPDVAAAIDVATVEATASPDGQEASASSQKSRRRAEPPPAVNDPLTFLTFVSEHPIGSVVEGTVESYVSHGAMVDVGAMRCYVPLAGLGSPAPRRSREVLERGERRQFVLVALDPARRGAELALPEFASRDDH